MITTKNLEALGLKHWQKNGMDRIYINVDMNAEYDERTLKCFFNRFERQNLKVFWDCKKEELVITHGSDEAKEVTKAIIEKMIVEYENKK